MRSCRKLSVIYKDGLEKDIKMLDVILVSNYSMKEELEQALLKSSIRFHDLMIQDIHHIERYPIKMNIIPS